MSLISLAYPSGEEGGSFTCSNEYYLPSRLLEEGGRENPMGPACLRRSSHPGLAAREAGGGGGGAFWCGTKTIIIKEGGPNEKNNKIKKKKNQS